MLSFKLLYKILVSYRIVSLYNLTIVHFYNTRGASDLIEKVLFIILIFLLIIFVPENPLLLVLIFSLFFSYNGVDS